MQQWTPGWFAGHGPTLGEVRLGKVSLPAVRATSTVDGSLGGGAGAQLFREGAAGKTSIRRLDQHTPAA